MKRGLVVGVVLGLTVAGVAGGAERDHPLLARHPGAELLDKSEVEDTAQWFPLSKPTRPGREGVGEVLEAEGKRTRLWYRFPVATSPARLIERYGAELAAGGFERRRECGGEECGPVGFWQGYFLGGRQRVWGHAAAQASVLLEKGAGEAVLLAYAIEQGQWSVLVLEILEAKSGDRLAVDPEALVAELEATGKATLGGILFALDRAQILPESKPALEAAAGAIGAMPTASRFWVVGHTDAQGSAEYNRELSKRRAGAVVEALVGEYAVDRGRLEAQGVGPYAPAATNASEAGRALNRRVELVRMLEDE